MTKIPALSIQQPWTWLIVQRHKKIENRSRACHYRGQVLLHAGLKVDDDAQSDLLANIHPCSGDLDPELGLAYATAWMKDDIKRGGIIGIAEIVGCVEESDDPFFCGPFGWVVDNARPLRFQPCRGMLGLFDPKIDVDLSAV